MIIENNFTNLINKLEQLKSEDYRHRVQALKDLPQLANIFGCQRIKNEIFPFLIEFQNDEEDVMLQLVDTIFFFNMYILKDSGALTKEILYFYYVMIYEDKSVWEKAFQKIQQLLQNIQQPNDYLFLLAKKLLKNKTQKALVSVCRLFCQFFEFFPSKFQTEIFQILGNAQHSPRCIIKKTLAYYLINFKKENHPFNQHAIELLLELYKDNYETVQVHALDSLCQFNISKTQYTKIIYPLIKESIKSISWRLRYVIASNIDIILKNIEYEHYIEILKDFCEFLNDIEEEVVIKSLQKFSTLVNILSEKCIKTYLIPSMIKNVQNKSNSIKIQICKNMFLLTQKLNKQEIQELYFPLIKEMIKIDNHDIKLAIFQNIHFLITKLGSEDVIPIFMEIYNQIVLNKDWKIWEKSIISFQTLVQQIPGDQLLNPLYKDVLKTYLNDQVYCIRTKSIEVISQIGMKINQDEFSQKIFPIIFEFRNHSKYQFKMNYLYGLKQTFYFLNHDTLQSQLKILQELFTDHTMNIKYAAFMTICAIFKEFNNDESKQVLMKAIDLNLQNKNYAIQQIIQVLNLKPLEESIHNIDTKFQ